MNKQVKAIRAEIDRRYEENRVWARYDDYYRGMNDGLDHLEQFINSLSEEKPAEEQMEVNLEKEYKEYVDDDPVFSKLTNRNVGMAIARHFYELGQAKQMPEEQPSKDLETEIATWIPAHLKGNVDEDIIDAVKRWGENVARHFVEWQKEQMLKDAVERVVKVDAGGYPYIDAMELYDYEKDKPLAKAGDKVKIIIVKEE